MADPPVAVSAVGSTIRGADGHDYLDAAGGAIVVNVGHGRREIAAVMADAGRPARVRARQRVHDRAPGGVRRRGRRRPPARWSRRSIRCRAARRRSRRRSSSPAPTTWPAVSPSARSWSPGTAAITATRSAPWTCPAGRRCAGPTSRGSAGCGTSRRRIPYRAGEAAAHALGDAQALANELDADVHRPGTGPSGGLRRRADRRGDARGRRSARRLLATRRRGLRPPRGPAHRRRGHDRLRANGALVRAGSLGRPPRHPGRGQGRDVRLLAVRVRRGIRHGPRHRHGSRARVRPRVHVLARARRGGRRAGGSAHPARRAARRGQRGEGERLMRCCATALPTTRGRATSAAAA